MLTKLIAILLVILLAASPASAWLHTPKGSGIPAGASSTSCTDDSHCISLWRFESGALTTDSKDSNTLTANNGPTADAVNYKEGSASVDLESNDSEYFDISDTNYTGPWKSTDTTKIGSVTFWGKLESGPPIGDSMAAFSKYETFGNKRTLYLGVYNNSGTLKARMTLGYNSGGSWEDLTPHASGLSLATWYFYSFSYDNSDKSYSMRVRGALCNTVGIDVEGTATLDANKLYVNTASVRVGEIEVNELPYFEWDGNIDRMMVFDKMLSSQDATEICDGTYSN